MRQTLSLEKVGRRLYFIGLTYDQSLRARNELGAKWDDERRQRWVGTTKKEEAEKFLADLVAPVAVATPASQRAAHSLGLDPSTPAALVADALTESGVRDEVADKIRHSETAEEIAALRVYAKVRYKARDYYVVAEMLDKVARQPLRCRLTTLDGMAPFWVDCADCELVRTYRPKERWDGRRYSGRTETVYDTIGSLRRFRDEQAKARKNGEPACASCGKRGRLVHDLEDGMMKCPSCCDIPAD
jgi:hypothetical protein